MGKATKRAKAKRKKYFTRLAIKNPKQFITEYSKRLSSWSKEIEKSGGKQREEMLTEALNILNACGKDIFIEYSDITHEILFEQFNPSFFLSVDRCVSNYSKLEEMGALYGRLTGGQKKVFYQKNAL
ncbi:MAG: hypothetical protein JJV89_03520 [Desulfosarcina sp.]|nr:hypothetical protein [Desulfobacterales bacterium]